MKVPGFGLRAERLLDLLSGIRGSLTVASMETGCIFTSYTDTWLQTLTIIIHLTRFVRSNKNDNISQVQIVISVLKYNGPTKSMIFD